MLTAGGGGLSLPTPPVALSPCSLEKPIPAYTSCRLNSLVALRCLPLPTPPVALRNYYHRFLKNKGYITYTYFTVKVSAFHWW